MADIAQQISSVEAHAQAAGVDLNIPEDQEPTPIQQAYIRKLAELQAIKNYEEDAPVRQAMEALESDLAGFPEWDASATYSEGDTVRHQGQRYVALPDVATGIAPDDVYDADANTGGWKPV